MTCMNREKVIVTEQDLNLYVHFSFRQYLLDSLSETKMRKNIL